MKASFQLAGALISLLTLASASPVQKRDAASVKICTGTNGTGECESLTVEFGTDIPVSACQTIAAPFANNIGTFEVQPGALCRVWTVSDTCTVITGGNAMVFPPGSDDFHNFNGQDIGAAAKSFTCQQCTNCL